ncbi:MAG: hypothetical protein ACC631_08810, partial [Halocynthiibacter sp.]
DSDNSGRGFITMNEVETRSAGGSLVSFVAAPFKQALSVDYFWLRVACLIACLPSAGALVLKVTGLMQMQTSVLYVFLPCAFFLIGVWWTARPGKYEEVGSAILLGSVAGLAATFAYDLIRIPFLILGQRVFMTIDTYGMWIMDASVSTGLTDVVGWTYHYANGITFGIIFALFLRGQHVIWAVLYAIFLETINLITPFTEIFGLSTNLSAIGILYLGHVAYGLPLGFMVRDWDKWLGRLRGWSGIAKWGVIVAGLVWLVWEAVSPERMEFDRRSENNKLIVEGPLLNPEFLRIDLGEPVAIENPGEAAVVINKSTDEKYEMEAGSIDHFTPQRPGIYQVFVEVDGKTHSSFILVEPVENIGQ